MDLIKEFLDRYRREYDFYDQSARLVAQHIESLLREQGIRAIVTARAKNPERLKDKVQKRNQERQRPYADLKEIYDDIVDLAGVRIALYFPGDRDKVDKLTKAYFDIIGSPKNFSLLPKEKSHSRFTKRFSGYDAVHYKIQLISSSLPDIQKRYSEAKIELQVASVLMHAWAEVEHDLVYKPLSGELSEEEYAILDQLNGMVIAGEIALERLQRAIEIRVREGGRKFSNHYDLAAFIHDAARPLLEAAPDDSTLGRIDILYTLLDRLELATPDKVKPLVDVIHPDVERRPIADQIIDQVLVADQERYELPSVQERYELLSQIREEFKDADAKKRARIPNIDNKIGKFLEKWIRFERIARQQFEPDARQKALKVLTSDDSGRNIPLRVKISSDAVSTLTLRPMTTFEILRSIPIAEEKYKKELDRMRNLRNSLVHGIEVPDSETLSEAIKILDDLTDRIQQAALETAEREAREHDARNQAASETAEREAREHDARKQAALEEPPSEKSLSGGGHH